MDPNEPLEPDQSQKKRRLIRLPHFHRRRRLADSPAGPPPFLLRFRKGYGGLLGRRQGWVSPVEGGLKGFAWRTEIDAVRDAARGIPEANWGAVLPRAVTATREAAEGEMAWIGAAWQRERHKYDAGVARHVPRLAASKHALEGAQDDEKRMEEEVFGPNPTSAPEDQQAGTKPSDSENLSYPGYVGFLDRQFRSEKTFSRGVTKEDYLRIYDTRFSTRTIGYWAIIAAPDGRRVSAQRKGLHAAR